MHSLLRRLLRRPETMTVTVTWEDIFAGHQYNAYACPIARSLARQTGRHWTVSPSFIYDQKNGQPWVDKSLKAAKFIHAFDTGRPVRPTKLAFTRAKRRSFPLG